jgi:hypothetical protein
MNTVDGYGKQGVVSAKPYLAFLLLVPSLTPWQSMRFDGLRPVNKSRF